MTRQYPRPQFQRDNWINLNGFWDFAFDDDGVGIQQKWYLQKDYDKQIVVPFPYQSALSNIHDVGEHDHVWYHKALHLKPKPNHRVFLHFGAVDYQATIYLNGLKLQTHTGGSSSFSCDITTYVEMTAIQDITIHVYDPSRNSFISRGKQTWKEHPFECFYDRTTGIWQTVWVEYVPLNGLQSIRFTPNIDNRSVRCELNGYDSDDTLVEVSISYQGSLVIQDFIPMKKEGCTNITIPENVFHLWSPEHPNLYDVECKVYHKETCIDTVQTYFGMRKVHTENGMIYLNNEPYFLRLILDQGYYPEGLVSYPDETQLKHDILLAKKMGFNGCRKHEKIEAERFLYYADKEGFLVSLEMPSAYSYKASKEFTEEWMDAIHRDYNHPSLFMYVPFNESWGVRAIHERTEIQDYVTGFYHLTKSLDPSRIVSTNDGWEQTKSDVCAIHTYQHGAIDDTNQQRIFRESITNKETLLSDIHTPHKKALYVGGYQYQNEPIILSEFGGISYANHAQNGWGYTGVANPTDLKTELQRIFNDIYDSEHLAGFCYTQLTDVEQEINGLLDYNRHEKLPLDTIREIVMNFKGKK